MSVEKMVEDAAKKVAEEGFAGESMKKAMIGQRKKKFHSTL